MKKFIICLSLGLVACQSGGGTTSNSTAGYNDFVTMPISSDICNSAMFLSSSEQSPDLTFGNSAYCMPFIKLSIPSEIPDPTQVSDLVQYYYGSGATLQSSCPAITYKSAVPFSLDSAYAKNTKSVVDQSLECVSSLPKVINPMIVFDIDDTLLSDYLSHCQNGFGKFDPEAAKKRDEMYALPVVPHMDEILSYAFKNNINVAFISARPTSEIELTKQDLIENLPQFKSEISQVFENGHALFVNEKEKDYTVDVFKNIAREELKAKGYNIILNIGDQYSDLNYTFPNKNPVSCSYKLPNFIYYIK